MKVRAIAIASPRANVVGVVELTCSPEALAVGYLDAAVLGSDQPPLPLESGTETRVPWENVRDARVLGNAVYLEIDTGSGQQHRLLLVRFSVGDDVTPRELRQRRLILRTFVVGAAAMALVLSLFSTPRLSPGKGPLVGLGVGGLLALLILVVGLATDRLVTRGGRHASIVRELFVGELMATLPRVDREPDVRHRPAWFKLPPLEGLLPRTTLAVALTIAGAMLASLVMARWSIWGDHAPVTTRSATLAPKTTMPRSSPEPVAIASTREQTYSPAPPPSGIAAAKTQPAAPHAQAAESASVQVTGNCRCVRADSPLWRTPIPRIAPVVIDSRRTRDHDKDEMTLELGAVNNGDRDVYELSFLVEFFEKDRSDSVRLSSISTRVLYYEGPLLFGKAIKWHVEAEGSSFQVHPPVARGTAASESIGPSGEGAAPASAFVELLQANHRPIRMYAAMMLAYLGDDRARPAVVELGEAMRDNEAPFLQRLLQATGEQRACSTSLTGTGSSRVLGVCVENRASTPQPGLRLRLRLLDNLVSPQDPVASPPQVLAEREFPLGGVLAPKAGVSIRATLDWKDLPTAVPETEVVVESQGP